MARHALLNNVEHKALRVLTAHSAALGDDVMYAVTFPAEFRNIQASYPIVFQKRADTGQFQALALFGFTSGENLFLNSAGWDASYVPVSIERVPFLIGPPGAAPPGGTPQLMVHIDLDHPRVNSVEGEPLFREHGGSTDFLDRISTKLHALHEGILETHALVEELLKHELLESFVLDVELKDGSHNRLAGFYTVNEERLHALDGATIAALHTRGFLRAIYMVVASTAHFRDLIDRRNRRL
jgi:hypothetical protein